MQSPDIVALFNSEAASTTVNKRKVGRTKVLLNREGKFEQFIADKDDVPLQAL